MLEFVDSGLSFVQDKNNFINPLLQLGSGSGSGRPNINGSESLSADPYFLEGRIRAISGRIRNSTHLLIIELYVLM